MCARFYYILSGYKFVAQYRLSPWRGVNNSIKASNAAVNESNEYFMSWETGHYRHGTKQFRNQSLCTIHAAVSDEFTY